MSGCLKRPVKRLEETINEKTEKALANTENIFAVGEGWGTQPNGAERLIDLRMVSRLAFCFSESTHPLTATLLPRTWAITFCGNRLAVAARS